MSFKAPIPVHNYTALEMDELASGFQRAPGEVFPVVMRVHLRTKGKKAGAPGTSQPHSTAQAAPPELARTAQEGRLGPHSTHQPDPSWRSHHLPPSLCSTWLAPCSACSHPEQQGGAAPLQDSGSSLAGQGQDRHPQQRKSRGPTRGAEVMQGNKEGLWAQ